MFEFVVVLLGVLAAQAVADYADDRRLAHAADVQFAQARLAAIDIANIMHYWRTVGPCMSDRARKVARAAAGDETMSAAAIGRPAMPYTRMPSWDEDVRQAALARFTAAQMEAIDFFEGRAEVIGETTSRVRDSWATFAMLDPAIGSPSAVDRGNVRLAAISVVDHIRLLGYNDPTAEMAALGVPTSEWQRWPFDAGRVDTCGMILNWR